MTALALGVDRRAQVVSVLCSVLPTRYRDFAFEDGTRFHEDLGMDSMSFLEFLVALEETLAIPLTAEMLRVQALRSLGDVLALIDGLRQTEARA